MSTTDGTSGRPGSGTGSGTASGSGSGASESDTRPMSAGPSGATKTATAVPAPDGTAQGGPTKAAAAPTSAGGQEVAAGKPVAAPVKGAAPAKKAAQGQRPAAQRPSAPAGRRVRLTVSRVDPWSAMKISFLLSVAIGIAMVVMVFVLWSVLAGMGIFDAVNDLAQQIFGTDGAEAFDIMDYIGLTRVISLAIVVGVIDVLLITAIATLGAFLYNVSAALVGGLQLTLTDD